MVATPTERELDEFEAYVRNLTGRQVLNVYRQEAHAKRPWYARIAKAELQRRGIDFDEIS
jgi:hypothetical protein